MLQQKAHLGGESGGGSEEQTRHEVMLGGDVAEVGAPPLAKDGAGEGVVAEQRRAEGDAEE